MKRSRENLRGLYAIGITALFLAGFFLLVVFGAQIYSNILSAQERGNDMRGQLAVLENALRSGDTAGGISVKDYNGGQVLCIEDGDTGFGLLIYADNGQLLQEYTSVTAQPDPEYADVLAQTDTFAVSQSGDLITVATDAGQITVRLRSEGGGTNE